MQFDLHLDSDLRSVIDMTAMILVSMKNDPSPPPSPIPSPIISMRSASPVPVKAETCDCMLCTRSTPLILNKCHTWAWIMRVVFYSLQDRHPEKKFFSLKNDVYEYMVNHWGPLGLDRKPSANWHKQIQDMLSHSRNIFESGMAHFKQNGFWRLKDMEDPWIARPDTPRPPSTTPPSTPTPSSPRKRGWKNQSDEEQEDEVVQIIQKRLCTPPASPRPSSISPRSSLSSLPPSLPSSVSSSPIPSPLPHLKSGEKLAKEVAILREQLHHMTESIAQLSTGALIDEPATSTPSSTNTEQLLPVIPASDSTTSRTTTPEQLQQQPQSQQTTTQQHYNAFSHNRVWEESYLYLQHQIGPVQA